MILKLVKLNFLMIILFTVESCNSFDVNNQIVGRYYLISSNRDNGKELGYKVNDDGDFVGIVRSDVIAVGYNNSYIIVKQYPKSSPTTISRSGDSIVVKNNTSENTSQREKKELVFYFIVPIHNDFTYYPEKGILGPFSLNDFNKQKLKLNIKADFTMDTN